MEPSTNKQNFEKIAPTASISSRRPYSCTQSGDSSFPDTNRSRSESLKHGGCIEKFYVPPRHLNGVQTPETMVRPSLLLNEELALRKTIDSTEASIQIVTVNLSQHKQKEEALQKELQLLQQQLKQVKLTTSKNQLLHKEFFKSIVPLTSVSNSAQENGEPSEFFLRIGHYETEEEAFCIYNLLHIINNVLPMDHLPTTQKALTEASVFLAKNHKRVRPSSGSPSTCRSLKSSSSNPGSSRDQHHLLTIAETTCICGEKTTSLDQHFNHIRLQIPTSSTIFQCPICSVATTNFCNFRFHFRQKHDHHTPSISEIGFICCGRNFTTFDELQPHLLRANLKPGNSSDY